MTEAQNVLKALALPDDRATHLERRPDGTMAKVPNTLVKPIVENPDQLSKGLGDSLGRILDAAKGTKADFDAKSEAIATLPDLTAELDAWQKQKDLNPLDSDTLRVLAGDLQAKIIEFNTAVDALPDKVFGADLLTVSGALARELATQAGDLIDPIGDTVTSLAAFAKSDGGSVGVGPASPFETARKALSKTSPDKYWSGTKKKILAVMSKEDKQAAASINKFLDQGFSDKLKTLGKTIDGTAGSGAKYMAAAADVAATISLYDDKLAALAWAGDPNKAGSAIRGLRTVLRAIADRVVTDTKYYLTSGLLTPGSR